MMNGPCHIHYAFIDEKRVSRHTMKDCKTFLKLQEVAGNKQAKARRQGYEGNTNNRPPANQQPNNGMTQGQNRLTRYNSANVLNEGLRIGEIGHRMNSKVRLVKIGVYRK
jgi:hypothetical protein